MVKWKGRSLGRVAINFSSNRPAGVDQSISPAHQFLVEGMFARTDTQVIECLLNEAVGDFGVLAEPARQRLLAHPQRPGLLANQQACGQTRLAPGIINSCPDRFHEGKVQEQTALCNPACRCRPRPMIFPPFTNTAPTIGLDEFVPQPRRASRRARRMNWASDIMPSQNL